MMELIYLIILKIIIWAQLVYIWYDSDMYTFQASSELRMSSVPKNIRNPIL